MGDINPTDAYYQGYFQGCKEGAKDVAYEIIDNLDEKHAYKVNKILNEYLERVKDARRRQNGDE